MKEIISLTLIIVLLIVGSYLMLESELTKAAEQSDQVVITQNVVGEIGITDCANFTMSQSIYGTTGGSATGECTWTVTTSVGTGFNMKLKASTAPALATASYSFADYTSPSAGTPDYTWTVAAADSEFGFTVEASTTLDTVQMFRDNGTDTCAIGSSNGVDTCWYKFATGDLTVINRSTQTSAGGEAEKTKFKATSGASHIQPEGVYQATITATATTNP